MVPGPGRGRGRGPADGAHQDGEVRLSGRAVLLPVVVPADHVGQGHYGQEAAGLAPQRHRRVQVRRAEGRQLDPCRQRQVLHGRVQDPGRHLQVRRRYDHAGAGTAVGRGRHHRAPGTGAGRHDRQEPRLRDQQGGLGREQISVVPLLEAAVQRCPPAPGRRLCDRPERHPRRARHLGPAHRGPHLAGEIRLHRRQDLPGRSTRTNARRCSRRPGFRAAKVFRTSNITPRSASTRRPRNMARSSPRCCGPRASRSS